LRQLDRYVLSRLIGPFLFFIVIFGAILWLNQVLRLADAVIDTGQSGMVFAELSVYLIPKVLETVVPMAAFASATFLTNRLYSEAELIILMGAGISPADATRPYFLFGGICLVLMIFLSQLLTPFAMGLFQDRQYQISREIPTRFIIPGAFSNPVPGITIFFGAITPDGAFKDVVIHDTRSRTAVTHTAPEGQILSNRTGPTLILFDGTIQHLEPDRRLSTIYFETLSYDLGRFAKEAAGRTYKISELHFHELLGSGRANLVPEVQRMTEFHDRIVKSLLAVAFPVLGAIVLLSSGFSRSGFFLRIALCVVFMVAVNALRGFVQPFAGPDAGFWPVLYAPVVLAFGAVIILLRMGLAPWKSGFMGFLRPGRTVP